MSRSTLPLNETAPNAVAMMRTPGTVPFVQLSPVSRPRCARHDHEAVHHQSRSDFEGTSMITKAKYADVRAIAVHHQPAAIHGSRQLTTGLLSPSRLASGPM